MAPAKTILSIDGGGIRGLIPALVLDHIESQTGHAIAELFDVIAGTSTGGILALGLTCPDPHRAPRYRASDLAQIYVDQGAEIFPHELLAKVRRLFEPEYPAKGRAAVLTDKLGDARLKDALGDVIVTSYDIERREPLFLRSFQARRDAGSDFAMRDVALATSAAPTFFEPVRLRSGDGTEHALVDGGVFANNPAMCAYVDGKSDIDPNAQDVLMLSLGTGSLTRPFPYTNARTWGLIQWGPHVLDVVFDGVSATVDHQLRILLRENYLRMEVELTTAKDDMDDVQRQNIDALAGEAARLIDSEHDALMRFCQKLADRAGIADR